MDAPSPTLRCELCGAHDLDELHLPGQAQASGLRVCRHCRLVYWPRPRPPSGRRAVPEPPDLSRYGPGGGASRGGPTES